METHFYTTELLIFDITMQEQEQLFELIKALTPHEKGYIRRMASLHSSAEETNYIRLFDAIDKQEKYDEVKLRKKLAKEKFMRNFAGAKNYLQQTILRHLESYQSSPVSEVRSLLSQHAILRSKGLVQPGYKLLRRAWSVCVKYELDHQKTEVLTQLLGHIITYGGKPEWPGGAEAILQQINETSQLNTEASKMRLELHQLRRQTPGLMRARTAEQSAELIRKAEILVQYDTSKLKSFDTRYQYYQLLTNYFFLGNENEKGLHYAAELCNWLLENWSYAGPQRRSFITAFYNKALYEMMLFRPSVRESIEALERLVGEMQPAQPDSQLLLMRLQLIEAWETCRYTDVKNYAAAALTFLHDHKALINRPGEELICLMLAACGQFALGETEAAAKSLRQLLRHPFEPNMQSLGSAARIFLLIAEFERGDRIGIENEVQNTYRYLLRKQQLHKVEKAVLDFLRLSLRKIRDRQEMKASFIQLKSEVELALADKNEEMGARLFDLVSYLESKITGESFAEIRKRTAEQNWKMKLPD